MRINLCIQCEENFTTQDFFKSNVCPTCESPKIIGFPTLISTVSLHTMNNVSKARLSELDKRVSLPGEELSPGHNAVGRFDRGKFTDKQVDLTP